MLNVLRISSGVFTLIMFASHLTCQIQQPLNAKIVCCQDEIKTVGSGPPSCARCPNSYNHQDHPPCPLKCFLQYSRSFPRMLLVTFGKGIALSEKPSSTMCLIVCDYRATASSISNLSSSVRALYGYHPLISRHRFISGVSSFRFKVLPQLQYS